MLLCIHVPLHAAKQPFTKAQSPGAFVEGCVAAQSDKCTHDSSMQPLTQISPRPPPPTPRKLYTLGAIETVTSDVIVCNCGID